MTSAVSTCFMTPLSHGWTTMVRASCTEMPATDWSIIFCPYASTITCSTSAAFARPVWSLANSAWR